LVIKPNLYFVKSRKMTKEERVIENIKKYLKQGKSRIAMFTFLLIFMLSFTIWVLWQEKKLNEKVTPENIRLLASFERPQRELPILFSRFYILAGLKAKLITHEIYFGSLTGFIIGMLILEIAGVTKNKHRLTLNMWERIQELENEVKELKVPNQVDGQQIADMDGGDITSGAE